MAGWIITSGGQPANGPWCRFNSVFDLSEFAELRTTELEIGNGNHLLIWGWGPQHKCDIAWTSRENRFLMVAGVLTDLGKYGNTSASLERNCQKILRLTEGQLPIEPAELNGSFSLLSIDTNKNELELITDRFASRSIWYGRDKKRWVVGNFPSAIAACFESTPEVDTVGAFSTLYSRRPVANRGIFSGINCISAGKKTCLDQSKGSSSTNWFRRKYRPDHSMTPDKLGENLAHAIQSSATRYRDHLEDPNIFLSGGMDSRLVAGAFGGGISTLTLCTKKNIESRIAEKVAAAIDSNHKTWQRSPYWYLEARRANALITSGNYSTGHCHYTVPVLERLNSRPSAEFLLGDLMENLGKHYFKTGATFPSQLTPDTLFNFLCQHSPSMTKECDNLGNYLNKDIRKQTESKYKLELFDYFNEFKGASEEFADQLDCLLRWGNVSLTYTFNMLLNFWPFAKERNIYFDNHLDDLSLTIPVSIRGRQILHEKILKNLCYPLAKVADANTLMSPAMPRIIKEIAIKSRPIIGRIRRLFKSKNQTSGSTNLNTSGSWLLMHELYRKDEKYNSDVRSVLANANLFPSHIFDHAEIMGTWDKYQEGDISRHSEIETLLSIGVLNRQFTE